MEVVGDSARGADFALVRLRIEGDRIVDADADGLDRPLAGLTLLEAAAVGGETLPVDALANALGRVFRARPDHARVAVAMSGGVDSAVALLRAGPNAVGVTLRLWVDPDGPDVERACCSPEAVLAARGFAQQSGTNTHVKGARVRPRRADRRQGNHLASPGSHEREATTAGWSDCGGTARFPHVLLG